MNHKRSEREFKMHLQEQIKFLETSCIEFDKGNHSEAKRIALYIRIIVHDTSKSNSLMKLLNIKDEKFIDSSIDWKEPNLKFFRPPPL